MRSASNRFLAMLVIVTTAQKASSQQLPQLGKNSIKEVIAAMTLEEKAKLVVGNGFSMPPGATPPGAPAPGAAPGAPPAAGNPAPPPPPPTGPMIGTTQQKVPGAAGTTFAIPRLGIPTMVLADGPAGVRISPIRNNDSSKTYYATAWPVGTLLASSWDTALIKKVGESFGNEVREYGVDILLAPGNNIHRNPLGGRNFEYYSEDPLVSGMAAASIISGIQSNGVGTSLKHYAGNEQETNRNTVNTIVSERALREIYLRPFGIAVKKSQPWTVMSSYNYINGPYTSENYDLLTTILRKEWGFKGFVMTDWGGGKDPVAQMKAGNDLIMPGQAEQTKRIISAVEHDSLDIKVLDENVARILNVMLQTPVFKGYKYTNAPDMKAHAAMSRKAATEGMILLKNDGKSLPLSGAKKIALFGNTSYDLIAGGTGSGDVNKAYTISIAKGLANAGYALDDALTMQYTSHIAEEKAKRPKTRGFMFAAPKPISELLFDENALSQLASAQDLAIITIGRNAGEGADRKVPNDFNISDTERKLINNVADAFHAKNKKLIVVLNIGGVIETASWRDHADAILLAWQPGLEGGNAVADILSGKVNPSGKLATTFPMKYEDVPSAKTFPGIEFPEKATVGRFGRKMIPAEVTYDEGVYVGYRYYNTFHVKPAYEFGYGLSYTDFTYSNLKLSAPIFSNSLKVSCTVTNTGKVAGKEIVQLYLSAPETRMDKPSAELKAFAKTGDLKPGASQTVTFTLTAADLASFDTPSTSWIADAGTYTVSIGSSSEKIRFSKTFTLAKDIVTEKVNKVLVPQVNINELKKH